MLVSILIITIFALIPFQRGKNNVDPWMKKVNDDTKIVNMSIPGTHDSGATHSIFDVSGKCQDLSIQSQLNIGVRFFDIRLQLVNDEFKIVHSFVDQKLKLESVLDSMDSFIKENNSEFLLVSLKKEESDKNSTLNFKEALTKKLNEYTSFCFDASLPETLKDARGKIYVLDRYGLDVGIKAYDGWLDSTSFELNNMYIQDNYCIDNIDIKKQDIVSTINYCNKDKNKLVINFTSCYLDNDFPPTYAGTAARLINPWLKDYIDDNKDLKLGIIVSDFISKELAYSIYMKNII